MNRATLVLVVSLAACGGGADPLFGGFTSNSGAAVILPSANCDIASLGPTALSGILLELSSRSDACNILTQAKQCGTGASSTAILAGAFSGIPAASTVAPADASTYPWLANPPSGAFKASIGSAAKVDATCTAAGSPPSMSGGSISITAVTASNVTGTMDMRFDNGQAYKASFDVAVCPVSIDTCSLFGPCGSHTCVQP